MLRDNVRVADLNAPPDYAHEIRLQLDDCVVSIWLPASAGPLGKAITALSDAGFDVEQT